MSRLMRFIIGLVCLIILSLIAHYVERDGIAGDLTERSRQALADANFGNVDVKFIESGEARYRTGILSGPVSPDVAEQARATVASLRGVHDARFDVGDGTISPYPWKASHDGTQLVLDGFVPDEYTRGEILATARTRFPDAEILDKMVVGNGAPAGDWLTAAQSGLADLGQLDSGYAALSDTSLTVVGRTSNAGIIAAIEENLAMRLPEGFSGSADITADAAPDAEVAAEVSSCQERIDAAKGGDSIAFATGSATLLVRPNPMLDNLAQIALDCPRTAIAIEGHTDSRGSAELNQQLSDQRAASVRQYLIGAGVPAERLSAQGFGETRPLDPADTAEAHARNRRTDFIVTARP